MQSLLQSFCLHFLGLKQVEQVFLPYNWPIFVLKQDGNKDSKRIDLRAFFCRSLRYDLYHGFIEQAFKSFDLSDAVVNFASISGQTVWKMVQYNLGQVINFKPDIVILEIGTNDLMDLRPEVVSSEIEKLVWLLHERYDVKSIAVSSSIHYQYQSVDDMIWNLS